MYLLVLQVRRDYAVPSKESCESVCICLTDDAMKKTDTGRLCWQAEQEDLLRISTENMTD